MQLVQIVISDIVSLEDRGKYGGAIGATWYVRSTCGDDFKILISSHS